MFDSLISRGGSSDSGIWGILSDSATDVFNTGKDYVGDVAEASLGGLTGGIKQAIPNWTNSVLGIQSKDQLERDTYLPANADRENTGIYAGDTGQSPISNRPVKEVLFDMFNLSGSGNTAIYIITAGVVVFLIVSTIIKK